LSNNSQKRDEINPQELYLRISVALSQLQEQRDALQEQLELIYNNIETYEITKKTIENIKELKEGDEILLPLGNIALIKAKIVNPEEFIVNIGADIALVKNADDTIKYIEKNLELLNNTREKSEQDFRNILQEIQSLEEQRLEIMRQIQSSGQGTVG